jgi:hypothetical protein
MALPTVASSQPFSTTNYKSSVSSGRSVPCQEEPMPPDINFRATLHHKMDLVATKQTPSSHTPTTSPENRRKAQTPMSTLPSTSQTSLSILYRTLTPKMPLATPFTPRAQKQSRISLVPCRAASMLPSSTQILAHRVLRVN